MKFVLKVVSIGPTEIKQGPKSSYSMFELIYKRDDKVNTKKVMSFNKEIFSVLSNAVPGQHYEVEQEKKGEYWEWLSVATVDAPEEGAASGAATANKSVTPYKKNGEFRTPEQIMRSTALEAAVEYLAGVAGTKADKTPTGVLEVANQFEGYLLNGYTSKALESVVKNAVIKDDLPFDPEA
jgi:hypothetical protein